MSIDREYSEDVVERVKALDKEWLENVHEAFSGPQYGTVAPNSTVIRNWFSGQVLQQHPPQIWSNEKTGEIVFDTAFMIALQQDGRRGGPADVENGREILNQIKGAVRRGNTI